MKTFLCFGLSLFLFQPFAFSDKQESSQHKPIAKLAFSLANKKTPLLSGKWSISIPLNARVFDEDYCWPGHPDTRNREETRIYWKHGEEEYNLDIEETFALADKYFIETAETSLLSEMKVYGENYRLEKLPTQGTDQIFLFTPPSENTWAPVFALLLSPGSTVTQLKLTSNEAGKQHAAEFPGWMKMLLQTLTPGKIAWSTTKESWVRVVHNRTVFQSNGSNFFGFQKLVRFGKIPSIIGVHNKKSEKPYHRKDTVFHVPIPIPIDFSFERMDDRNPAKIKKIPGRLAGKNIVWQQWTEPLNDHRVLIHRETTFTFPNQFFHAYSKEKEWAVILETPEEKEIPSLIKLLEEKSLSSYD